VQVALVLQNTPPLPATFGELEIEYIPVGNAEAKFDLLFDFREGQDGMNCAITYNVAQFSRPYIEDLGNRLTTLIEQVTENPDLPICEYAVPASRGHGSTVSDDLVAFLHRHID